jgi:hypothetical protein
MSNVTPFLSMSLPVVGVDSGPIAAQKINSALTTLDVAAGVPTTPSMININSDLAFNNFNATNLRSVRFENLAGAISSSGDLSCFYMVGNNAFVNMPDGTQVQLILNKQINAAVSGAISWNGSVSSSPFTASINNSQQVIGLATNVGGFSIQLPACSSGKWNITFKDSGNNAGSNSIFLFPKGADALEGASGGSLALNVNNCAVTLQSDGVSKAYIVNAYKITPS